VSIIDTKTLTVVDSLRSESFPIRVKFTPDGKHVLVSNAQSGNVTVFDVKQRKEVRKISFEVKAIKEQEQRLFGGRFGSSPAPVGIVVPSDGKFAYVANLNADVIGVVELSIWKVVSWIKAGREPDGLGWSPVVVQGPTSK
jgi:YVTN family beta-propeller protein